MAPQATLLRGTLAPVSECGFESWLLPFPSGSLLMELGRHRKMAQVLRPSPPAWETQMESLVPGFRLA